MDRHMQLRDGSVRNNLGHLPRFPALQTPDARRENVWIAVPRYRYRNPHIVCTTVLLSLAVRDGSLAARVTKRRGLEASFSEKPTGAPSRVSKVLIYEPGRRITDGQVRRIPANGTPSMTPTTTTMIE